MNEEYLVWGCIEFSSSSLVREREREKEGGRERGLEYGY
jgi:hypothetical protein